MTRWKVLPCGGCRGYGVVSVYSHGDFEGPGECRDCGGAGHLFVSESGRVADYPGGPLRGSWPSEFQRADAAGVPDWKPALEESSGELEAVS